MTKKADSSSLIAHREAEDYFDDYADDDGECACDGCGKEDGNCPLCCPMGMYAPGTEDCDFCEYSDECAAGL